MPNRLAVFPMGSRSTPKEIYTYAVMRPTRSGESALIGPRRCSLTIDGESSSAGQPILRLAGRTSTRFLSQTWPVSQSRAPRSEFKGNHWPMCHVEYDRSALLFVVVRGLSRLDW